MLLQPDLRVGVTMQSVSHHRTTPDLLAWTSIKDLFTDTM